jgi:hypothetical protein
MIAVEPISVGTPSAVASDPFAHIGEINNQVRRARRQLNMHAV